MDRWLPKGSLSSASEGAFERFLTAAIATIITIIFSWRMLDIINEEKREGDDDEPESERLGQCLPVTDSNTLVSLSISPTVVEPGRFTVIRRLPTPSTRPQFFSLYNNSTSRRVISLSDTVLREQRSSENCEFQVPDLYKSNRVPVDLPLCGDTPNNVIRASAKFSTAGEPVGILGDSQDVFIDELTGDSCAEYQLPDCFIDRLSPGVGLEVEQQPHDLATTVDRSVTPSQAAGKHTECGNGCETCENTLPSLSKHNGSDSSIDNAQSETVDITDSSLEDASSTEVDKSSLHLNITADKCPEDTNKTEYPNNIEENWCRTPEVKTDRRIYNDNCGDDFVESYDDYQYNYDYDFDDDVQPRELDSDEELFCCSILEPITEENSDDMLTSSEGDTSSAEHGTYNLNDIHIPDSSEYSDINPRLTPVQGIFTDELNFNVNKTLNLWPEINIEIPTVNIKQERPCANEQRPISSLRYNIPDKDTFESRLQNINTQHDTELDYQEGGEGIPTNQITCTGLNSDAVSGAFFVTDAPVSSEKEVDVFKNEYSVRCFGTSVDKAPTNFVTDYSQNLQVNNNFIDRFNTDFRSGSIDNLSRDSGLAFEEGDQFVSNTFLHTFSTRVEVDDSNSDSDESVQTVISRHTLREPTGSPVRIHGLISHLYPLQESTDQLLTPDSLYSPQKLPSGDEIGTSNIFKVDNSVSLLNDITDSESPEGKVNYNSQNYKYYDTKNRNLLTDLGSELSDKFTTSRNEVPEQFGEFINTEISGSYVPNSESDQNKQENGVEIGFPSDEQLSEETEKLECDGDTKRNVIYSENVHEPACYDDEFGGIGVRSGEVSSVEVIECNPEFSDEDKESVHKMDKFVDSSFGNEDGVDEVREMRGDSEEEWTEDVVETFILPLSPEITVLRTMHNLKDLLDQRRDVKRPEFESHNHEDDNNEEWQSTCTTTMIDVEGHNAFGFRGGDDDNDYGDGISGYREQSKALARVDKGLKEKFGFQLNLDEYKSDEYSTSDGWPVVRLIERDRVFVDESGHDGSSYQDDVAAETEMYQEDERTEFHNEHLDEGDEKKGNKDETEEEIDTYTEEHYEIIPVSRYPKGTEVLLGSSQAKLSPLLQHHRVGQASVTTTRLSQLESTATHTPYAMFRYDNFTPSFLGTPSLTGASTSREPYLRSSVLERPFLAGTSTSREPNLRYSGLGASSLSGASTSREPNLKSSVLGTSYLAEASPSSKFIPRYRPSSEFLPRYSVLGRPYLAEAPPSSELNLRSSVLGPSSLAEVAPSSELNLRSPDLEPPPLREPSPSSERNSPKHIEHTEYTPYEINFDDSPTSYSQDVLPREDTDEMPMDDLSSSKSEVVQPGRQSLSSYYDFVRQMSKNDDSTASIETTPIQPSPPNSDILSGNVTTINTTNDMVPLNEQAPYSQTSYNDDTPSIVSDNGNKEKEGRIVENWIKKEEEEPEENLKKPKFVRTSTAQNEDDLIGRVSGTRTISWSSGQDVSTSGQNRSTETASSSVSSSDRSSSDWRGGSGNTSRESGSTSVNSRETAAVESPILEYRRFQTSPNLLQKTVEGPLRNEVLEEQTRADIHPRGTSKLTYSTSLMTSSLRDPLPTSSALSWTRVIPGSNFVDEKITPSPEHYSENPFRVQDIDQKTNPFSEQTGRDLATLDSVDGESVPVGTFESKISLPSYPVSGRLASDPMKTALRSSNTSTEPYLKYSMLATPPPNRTSVFSPTATMKLDNVSKKYSGVSMINVTDSNESDITNRDSQKHVESENKKFMSEGVGEIPVGDEKEDVNKSEDNDEEEYENDEEEEEDDDDDEDYDSPDVENVEEKPSSTLDSYIKSPQSTTSANDLFTRDSISEQNSPKIAPDSSSIKDISPTTPAHTSVTQPTLVPFRSTAGAQSQFVPLTPKRSSSMKDIKRRYKQPYTSVLTMDPSSLTPPKAAPFILPEQFVTPSRLKINQSRNRFLSEQDLTADSITNEFKVHKGAIGAAHVKNRMYAPRMSRYSNYRSQEQLEKLKYMINLKPGRSEGSLNVDCLHDDCILSEKGRREILDKTLSIENMRADLRTCLRRFCSENDGPLSDSFFPETNSDMFDLTFPFQEQDRYFNRPSSMGELRHAYDYSTISSSVPRRNEAPDSQEKFIKPEYKKSRSLCALESSRGPAEGILQRPPSAHDLRISKSLQKLNIPDWYKHSSLPRNGSSLLRHSSSSNLASLTIFSPSTTPTPTSNVVIRSRVQMPTSARNLRSPRSSSKSAPTTPSFMNQTSMDSLKIYSPVKLPSEKMRTASNSQSLKPIPIVPFQQIRAVIDKKKEDPKVNKQERPNNLADSSSPQPVLTRLTSPETTRQVASVPRRNHEFTHSNDAVPEIITSPTDVTVKSILKRPQDESNLSNNQRIRGADTENIANSQTPSPFVPPAKIANSKTLSTFVPPAKDVTSKTPSTIADPVKTASSQTAPKPVSAPSKIVLNQLATTLTAPVKINANKTPIIYADPAKIVLSQSQIPKTSTDPVRIASGQPPITYAEPAKIVLGQTPITYEEPAKIVLGQPPITYAEPAKIVLGQTPITYAEPAKIVLGQTPITYEEPAKIVLGHKPITYAEPAKIVLGQTPITYSEPAKIVLGQPPITYSEPAKIVLGQTPITYAEPAKIVLGQTPNTFAAPTPIRTTHPLVLVNKQEPENDQSVLKHTNKEELDLEERPSSLELKQPLNNKKNTGSRDISKEDMFLPEEQKNREQPLISVTNQRELITSLRSPSSSSSEDDFDRKRTEQHGHQKITADTRFESPGSIQAQSSNLLSPMEMRSTPTIIITPGTPKPTPSQKVNVATAKPVVAPITLEGAPVMRPPQEKPFIAPVLENFTPTETDSYRPEQLARYIPWSTRSSDSSEETDTNSISSESKIVPTKPEPTIVETEKKRSWVPKSKPLRTMRSPDEPQKSFKPEHKYSKVYVVQSPLGTNERTVNTRDLRTPSEPETQERNLPSMETDSEDFENREYKPSKTFPQNETPLTNNKDIDNSFESYSSRSGSTQREVVRDNSYNKKVAERKLSIESNPSFDRHLDKVLDHYSSPVIERSRSIQGRDSGSTSPKSDIHSSDGSTIEQRRSPNEGQDSSYNAMKEDHIYENVDAMYFGRNEMVPERTGRNYDRNEGSGDDYNTNEESSAKNDTVSARNETDYETDYERGLDRNGSGYDRTDRVYDRQNLEDDRIRNSYDKQDTAYDRSKDNRIEGYRDRDKDYYDRESDADRRESDFDQGESGTDQGESGTYQRKSDSGQRDSGSDLEENDSGQEDYERQDLPRQQDQDWAPREEKTYSLPSDSEILDDDDLDGKFMPKNVTGVTKMPIKYEPQKEVFDKHDKVSKSSAPVSSGRTWQPKPRKTRGAEGSSSRQTSSLNNTPYDPSVESNGGSTSLHYRYKVAGSAFNSPRPGAVAGLNTPPSDRRVVESPSPSRVSSEISGSRKGSTVTADTDRTSQDQAFWHDQPGNFSGRRNSTETTV